MFLFYIQRGSKRNFIRRGREREEFSSVVSWRRFTVVRRLVATPWRLEMIVAPLLDPITPDIALKIVGKICELARLTITRNGNASDETGDVQREVTIDRDCLV